ncbi:aldo/keto reductase [Clostridium felsineum]|uniref:Aldo-keto reductase IolS n=1 Tax=Clostridium felsineum TaxID=36839 RepID=A0A1S8L6E3_9CLOT|nr:aldo/keto reductase [Clostridium felsineum]URZ05533.1 Aldo-keto reductase IolS [Clostridium felsineum]URZ10572.1 Aldo-keto reductase IolS [Clostridium felsineum]
MIKRKLGISNIEVSPIGLGCMGMDHAYGKQANRNDMIKLIRKEVQLGCDFFDTAVVYGEANEELLGEAIKPIRNKVVIATKFGITGQEVIDGKPENILDSSPKCIREQLEGSLKRLKVDSIDLYYQHRVDPKVEPEVVGGVMKELIAEGKIKSWGLSNAPIDYIRRAHEVCPLAAIENQYSMVWREPEKELFNLCEELGISFVAYSPLGNGFLSGKYTKDTKYEEGDFRSFMGRFKPEVMEKNQALLDIIEKVAENKNATSAQIVLAWELAQKPYIIPIPGTTKLHRLKENLGTYNVELSKEELNRINEALSKIDIDETHF